jgi:hypothetical protein
MESGIVFNIICYFIMTVTMVVVSSKVQSGAKCLKGVPYKIKIGSSLALLCWAMFMTLYLVVDYPNIVASPLNVRLNFFESITNILLPMFLIGSYFSEDIIKLIKNENK